MSSIIERFEHAGKLLYGDRWQAPLARAMGAAQPTIAMTIKRNKVSIGLRLMFANALSNEIRRLHLTAAELDTIRKESLHD